MCNFWPEPGKKSKLLGRNLKALKEVRKKIYEKNQKFSMNYLGFRANTQNTKSQIGNILGASGIWKGWKVNNTIKCFLRWFENKPNKIKAWVFTIEWCEMKWNKRKTRN